MSHLWRFKRGCQFNMRTWPPAFLHPVVGNSACWPHQCDLGLLQSWALKPVNNSLPTVTNYVSVALQVNLHINNWVQVRPSNPCENLNLVLISLYWCMHSWCFPWVVTWHKVECTCAGSRDPQAWVGRVNQVQRQKETGVVQFLGSRRNHSSGFKNIYGASSSFG